MGALTAGTITLDSTGHIKSGQTDYDTGSGFWLGRDGGTGKFSIGNGTDNSFTWDGTSMRVSGELRVGKYSASDVVRLTANTNRNTLTPGHTVWVELKKFQIDRSGVVRVKFEYATAFGEPTIQPIEYRVRVNGVTKNSGSASTSGFKSISHDVTISDTDTNITLDFQSNIRSGSIEEPTHVKNATISANISFGEAVITD